MDIRITLLALFILVSPVHLLAGDVYRSVDAEGNVTYTDDPPATDSSVEKIEIHPGPSEASRLDTEKRNAAIRKAMEEAREKRLEKEASHNAELAEARKALEQAEKELEQAKEIDEDSRQYLSGGRSRLSPAYLERIKEVEAKVEAARKKYKEVRGY
jgi:vacuolar-type H+-ATPase subunit I/STV1